MSVACRLDADASMVGIPPRRNLMVSDKEWPESWPTYYNAVPDGKWLVFAQDLDVLYTLNRAEFSARTSATSGAATG